MKILYAEDEKQLSIAVVEILKMEGFDVTPRGLTLRLFMTANRRGKPFRKNTLMPLFSIL